MAELGSGIICVCIPPLRPLFSKDVPTSQRNVIELSEGLSGGTRKQDEEAHEELEYQFKGGSSGSEVNGSNEVAAIQP